MLVYVSMADKCVTSKEYTNIIQVGGVSMAYDGPDYPLRNFHFGGEGKCRLV